MLTLFTVIGIRLVVLQVVENPDYADAGIKDRLRSVILPAPRGSIYDRDGEVLAHSVEARYVFADPSQIDDPVTTAQALSEPLGIPAAKLAEKMRKRKSNGYELEFVYLKRGVDIDVAEQIEDLELKGVDTRRDEGREVPGGGLAANLIGFTSDDMVGLEGLEAGYDKVLAGKDGKERYEAGWGAQIPGGFSETTEAKPGSSLCLTLDRDLQYMVQAKLAEAMEAVNGSTATAVVLEVGTSEVLAQASYPTYDVANWRDSDPADRDDVATGFVVEPGSVHKAITFGAALQEGVITPQTAFPVANSVPKGDTPFPDGHPVNGRTMSIPGMLAFSSNVGTIEVADQLGPERLIDYQKRFGLGQRTNEGMPGEASGRVLPLDEWSGSSYGSVPIGHSVDATAIQMAAAYATIANDGTYVAPRLVKETIDGTTGKRTPSDAPATRSVLSPENAVALRTMLEAVTTVDGPEGQATGLAAAIPGYRVAGKTGTGLRYVDGKRQPGEVGSFIGMAPAENPRFVVAVFVWSPSGGGGVVAAPVFRELMSFALRHYRVPPSTEPAPTFTIFP